MTDCDPERLPVTAVRTTMRNRLGFRDERGQVLVLTALMMVVLLGMAGMALDVMHAYVQQQTVQTVADSAALAGADDLPGSATTAIAHATHYAHLNHVRSGVGGTTVEVFSPPQDSKSHDGDPYSVEVVITRKVPTDLLKVLGIDSITVTGHSVATSDAVSPCALCIMGRTGQALVGNGNDQVAVTGAALQVNSSSAQGAVLDGNTRVGASQIGVVGGYAVNGTATFAPVPQTGVAPVPDPLATVQPPALTGPAYGDVTATGKQDATLQPGIYGSITAGGKNSLNFEPGTYVITGGLTLNGSTALNGSGVTLYLTCPGYSATDPAPCGGQSGAGLTDNGNGSISLSPPTSGPYAGLAIFYDRGNAASLTLNGNPGVVSGTIYALSGTGVFNGNAGAALNLDSLILMNSLTLNGNGDISIDYKPTQNYLARGSSHLTE